MFDARVVHVNWIISKHNLEHNLEHLFDAFLELTTSFINHTFPDLCQTNVG